MSDDKRTALIHHPYRPPPGFAGVAPPVHKASTVIFDNVAALRGRSWKSKAGYTYGLHGTPTSFTLEERIATLEGGLQTLLVPSGLAALTLVDCALLGSGDEVLIPTNAYGPNKDFAAHELARWGIGHRLYDPMDAAGLEAMIGPNTRLLWLEAAGSVTMEFPDLPVLVRSAQAHGVVSALDNTWGAGIAFDPFDLSSGVAEPVGVDISTQALTKYPSGGGDVLMGSVTTRDESLHRRLKSTHMRSGWGFGANDIELVLRSLPTLDLRYCAQDRAARDLAAWWQGRAEVARVLHPAFDGSPGHAHWKSLCNDSAAGLFSIVFSADHGQAEVDRFVDSLRLFKIGYSWAGPISLVVPYDLRALRGPAAASEKLVRFSVGLEAAADLIGDCEQALARIC